MKLSFALTVSCRGSPDVCGKTSDSDATALLSPLFSRLVIFGTRAPVGFRVRTVSLAPLPVTARSDARAGGSSVTAVAKHPAPTRAPRAVYADAWPLLGILLPAAVLLQLWACPGRGNKDLPSQSSHCAGERATAVPTAVPLRVLELQEAAARQNAAPTPAHDELGESEF